MVELIALNQWKDSAYQQYPRLRKGIIAPRVLYSMRYFHGTKDSARLQLRAMALIWNCHPYGGRTKFNNPSRSSPFKDLNGFQYHDNWLHNDRDRFLNEWAKTRQTGRPRASARTRLIKTTLD